MAAILEHKQQQHLNGVSRELTVCNICRQGNQPLFGCSFNACNQSNRMLCQRCGQFTHQGSNHSFDTASNHIHPLTITLALDRQSKIKIKKNAKQMHLLEQSIHEDDAHGQRNGFVGTLGFGFNAITQLDMAAVSSFVKNEEYFAKAFSAMITAVKNGNLGECGSKLHTVLYDIGDFSLEVTKTCKEGAMVAGAAMFVCEFLYLTYQFGVGNISLKLYAKKILTSIAVSFGACVGNIGGSAVGAAIGTLVFPGIGTAIGSVLGGLLGALFGGAAAKKTIEDISWLNDKNDQMVRHTMIKEALIAFGFRWTDIKNPAVFNERGIAQMYRTLAKVHHPDRGGRPDAFQKLNGDMALLLSLLEKSEKVKTKIAKQIQAITLVTN